MTLAPAPAFPARFDGHSSVYLHWRDARLALQQTSGKPLATRLTPALDSAEDEQNLASIVKQVSDIGFALYQWSKNTSDHNDSVATLHASLSLHTHDQGVVHDNNGLSLLTDLSGTRQGRFIPYTTRAMSWHTDGYYNSMEQSLGCFTLHCISPAHDGGGLTLLDHQLILIALYDQDPQLVELLAHSQAMMLPANKDGLGHDRPERYSPVLFTRPDGTPGAHFTTRSKHIQWRTPDTLAAATQMKQLIDQHPHWHYPIRLSAGQGVITRNVLHRREAYTDHPDNPRKMLRGRYLQAPQRHSTRS